MKDKNKKRPKENNTQCSQELKRVNFFEKDGHYHDNGRHGHLSSGRINWSHFEY